MKKRFVGCLVSLLIVCAIVVGFFAVPAEAASFEAVGLDGCLRYSRMKEGDARKAAYVILVEAIEGLQETAFFPMNTGVTVSDIFNAFGDLSLDLPEYFYADSVSVYGGGDGTGYWADIYYRLDGKALSREDVIRVKGEVAGKVEQILASVPADVQTDYDKALFVHDYLANNIVYEMVGSHQTVYGALVEGRCVCAGYANAYTLLMRRLGVKTWYIKGYSRDERHAWNVSWIDGECVYTDVTWDDLDPGVRYTYFNISGEQMKKDHTPDGLYDFMLGTCTHTGHEYKPGPQKTMYINLRTSGLSLTERGETVKLSPVVGPENAVNKEVKFESSDPSIVRVDADGTVTAVGEGTAEILVTAVDGGAQASCPVVVEFPKHQIEVVAEKSASCEQAGWEQHYRCVTCGALFVDSEGSVALGGISEIAVPAKGHCAGDWQSDADGHWAVCLACGVFVEEWREHVDVDLDGMCDTCACVVESGFFDERPADPEVGVDVVSFVKALLRVCWNVMWDMVYERVAEFLPGFG